MRMCSHETTRRCEDTWLGSMRRCDACLDEVVGFHRAVELELL